VVILLNHIVKTKAMIGWQSIHSNVSNLTNDQKLDVHYQLDKARNNKYNITFYSNNGLFTIPIILPSQNYTPLSLCNMINSLFCQYFHL
jgi:hypothetical protein